MLDKFFYTSEEIDELVKSQVILVDTREKVNGHITKCFDEYKIPYKKHTLRFGDYSFMVPANNALNIPRDLYFNHEVIVERKASLEEISGNLTKDRSRFEKELALAPPSKVLLIENASYSDIATGNYKTELNRKAFLASLHTFWFRYNMPVFFLENKRYSGLFIKKYFEYYLKEQLR